MIFRTATEAVFPELAGGALVSGDPHAERRVLTAEEHLDMIAFLDSARHAARVEYERRLGKIVGRTIQPLSIQE